MAIEQSQIERYANEISKELPIGNNKRQAHEYARAAVAKLSSEQGVTLAEVMAVMRLASKGMWTASTNEGQSRLAMQAAGLPVKGKKK